MESPGEYGNVGGVLRIVSPRRNANFWSISPGQALVHNPIIAALCFFIIVH